jgi:hypothetical protein
MRQVLFFRSTLVLGFLLLASFAVYAQPGGPPPDPDVPITGLELLVGGGIYLGVRNILNRNSKKNR